MTITFYIASGHRWVTSAISNVDPTIYPTESPTDFETIGELHIGDTFLSAIDGITYTVTAVTEHSGPPGASWWQTHTITTDGGR